VGRPLAAMRPFTDDAALADYRGSPRQGG